MCEYGDIKGSVDEATLLSNAQQRSEKGPRAASHETELLSEGLKTVEKHQAVARRRKCARAFQDSAPGTQTALSWTHKHTHSCM